MQLKLGQLFVCVFVVCPPMACSSGGQSGGVEVTGAAGAATAGTTGAAGTTSAAGTVGATGAGGVGSGATGSAGTGGGTASGAAGTSGGAGTGGKKIDAADGGGDVAVISPPSAVDAGAEAAHIRETASTNTPEINVSVYADGSAERKVGAGNNVQYVADKSYAAGAPEVVAFLAELRTVGDVSKIPTASDCAKSASFGTRTIVSADGASSGDMQCLLASATDADVELALDARRLDGTIQ